MEVGGGWSISGLFYCSMHYKRMPMILVKVALNAIS